MQAAKGHTNIPLNEPQLAQAANDAAAAAARRPRPFYKFEQQPGEPQPAVYANDRKLSAGESAGDLFVAPTQTRQEDLAQQQLANIDRLLGLDGAGPSSMGARASNLVPGILQQLEAELGPETHLPLDQVPGMTVPHNHSQAAVYHQMTASHIPEVYTPMPSVPELNPEQASAPVHSHVGGAGPSYATGVIQEAGAETENDAVSAAIDTAAGVVTTEPASIDEIEPAAIPQQTIDPAYIRALATQQLFHQTTSLAALPGSMAMPGSHPAVLQVPRGGYLTGTPTGFNSSATLSSVEGLQQVNPGVNFGGTNPIIHHPSMQGQHHRR